MGMDMRCAIVNGILHREVPLQPLSQVPRLRYVDWNPTPILGLFRVNKVAGYHLERRIDRENRVGIFLS